MHERVIVQITSPMQWLVRTSINAVSETISGYFFLVGVKKENKTLHQEISDLRSLQIHYKELELENYRLKNIFSMDIDDSYYKLVAKKIAHGSSKFEQVIRIQKGTRHGVKVGMPVLNSNGIVGQVISAYHTYADVLLITDPSSSLDVIVQRSRVHGMLKGGSKNQLHFEFLDKEADIFENDVVITSGLDGIYPKGYLVGKVNAIGARDHKLFLEATVKPFVNFRDIEEVIVLLPKVNLIK